MYGFAWLALRLLLLSLNGLWEGVLIQIKK